MWTKLVVAGMMAMGSAVCFAQGAQGTQDVQTLISACAKDTGPADCPVTYQALRASDCLRTDSNRACLIRLAKEAATANDCGRAYQLVYACQCSPHQETARDSIKAAGQDAVCKYLRAG
jgi:hypothetical protein